MSNVHGLGSLRSDNSNNRSGAGGPRVQRLGPPPSAADRSQSVSDLENGNSGAGLSMFGSGPSADGSPLPSVGQLLCPRFKASARSLIFVVSVIDVLMLIVAFVVNGVDYGTPFDTTNKMLGPSTLTFLKLRAKYTPLIKTGQVDRLFVPIFLHAGIIHLVFNLFFQCNVGFRMEEIWGVPRLGVIYFAAGIGGNLMSALLYPNTVGVGASGSLFGLLGGMIAFLIGNWSDIPGACMNMCNVVLMIVVNFLLGVSSNGLVDNYAHLGGLISGFCVAMAIPKKLSGYPEAKDGMMRNVGILTSLAYFGATVAVLFAK